MSESAIFMWIGFGAMFLAIAYMIYQFARVWGNIMDVDQRYSLLEIVLIDKIALKKGIDLNKEEEKKRLLKTNNFRKKMRDQMLVEMFGKQ